MIIPFFIPHAGCPHQCVFCNQKNITGRREPADASSIPRLVTRYLRTRPDTAPAQAAFYGGSFTALPVSAQKEYLEAVQPFIASGRLSGVRLSTRPDNITADILDFLERYHVRTIELGAQSLDDKVLALSGRGHTAGDTVAAVSLLRERGFAVGLQLMPGLPGDSPAGFRDTVGRAISLKPDFVRLYPALVIKDTPLERLYRAGRFAPLSLADAVEICRDGLERFERAGIEVIRIGLQAAAELDRPGTVVAGPYHPAFRQLVEASRFLDRMRGLLDRADSKRPVTFFVNPSDLSSAVGQKRHNIRTIREQYGLDVLIRSSGRIPRGAVRTEPACVPSE